MLSSLHLQLLIAPFVSFGHCVICPSICSFWLPLWYLLVIVLSFPPFTASDCPFGIFWSLCYLCLHLQLLIAPFKLFGHCVICPSSYSFWLPLWNCLVIVFSVPPVIASDCPFDIFWSLCYSSLHLQLLIAPLISVGHCVIRPSSYSFWLPLWYLLVIVLSVPPVTASDCPFGIFWLLCYLSLQLQLLIAPLVSFGHCVIRPSIYIFWLTFDICWSLCYRPSSYSFWLPLWYLLVIVLFVPPVTASDCPFDIFWSLCYLSLHLQLLIALWYLLVIVLSVPPVTASDCPFVSFGHCVICPSSYSFWLPLWYLLVIVLSSLHLLLLIAPFVSFGHCAICPSIYSFWLPLWYLLVIVLSFPPFTASDCPFAIFWSLCYLCLHLQLLIAPCLSFGHCFICPSIYIFWLPLWNCLVIVLFVHPVTASDCPFDIFWLLCYRSLQLRLLIAPLISFSHCVIRPFIYSFWLPLWYPLVIVLSVPPFTASDCPFEIVWSLCYLSIQLQLLIAPLISFGYYVIVTSIYSFWLPLWYLLVIVLSVPPFTASDCPFDILWSLCYPSLQLQLRIAPLISFDHCVICTSIYSFWLPFDIFWSLCYLYLHLQLLIALWYLLVIVLFVPPVTASDCPLWCHLVIVLSVPPFTSSDCPFGIFWSLCYLYLHLQLLIAPLLSFGHCVIHPSIYSFWLPFDIFWSLCYLSLYL